MWTQKYRPKKLNSIVGNQANIKAIKAMMPNIPHMLLKGAKPGVGKTTTALAIVHELGCEYKEINASDDRGINTIRDIIKPFANTSSMNGKFKVVILDEVDSTTPEFQTSLRRVMEQHSNNTKFILTCNYPHRLIEPIHSRCSGGTFEFLPIEYDEFKRGIMNVLNAEKMTITEEALIALHERSGGDMRIVDKLYSLSFQTRDITLSDIMAIRDDDSWKDLLKLIKAQKYVEACKFSKNDHVWSMYHALLGDDSITDDQKMLITKNASEWEFRSHFAKSEYLQLHALIANLISILKSKNTQKESIVKKEITTNIFGVKR